MSNNNSFDRATSIGQATEQRLEKPFIKFGRMMESEP
jgi:hypothetical protein